MAALDDFKNLNTKDPGSWPWLVKIVCFILIFALIVAAGGYFKWKTQWETLQKRERKEAQLKEEFLKKKKVAINLDLIKKQLSETKESFGALLKQLPDKSEMDALLTDINQAGLGRGLQFELFKPGGEKKQGAFAEQPISIVVTGHYDDFGKFASDVSVLPRIVTLNNISIKPAGEKLRLKATAKTFRYLEEQ